MLQQRLRERHTLQQRAAPNPQRALYERRIVDEKMFFAFWRAVIVNERHRRFDQSLGEFGGIGDGRRGENELRRGAIERGNAFQATHHIRDVRTEHTAIRVHLVHHDESQMPEKFRPQGVMRQNAGVQHIGIGDDDARSPPNRRARVLGRIAIVRRDQ